MKHDHSLSRFAYQAERGPRSRLSEDHPAVQEGRTRYPAMVRHASGAKGRRVLKSGHNNGKIGRVVRKGKWAGYPIWTLTLEERATCPRSCKQWHDCYGNKMHFSERLVPGPALENRISAELAEHQVTNPGGFVVRLHILGDFYSVDYVVKWRDWLKKYPALHVFGYTAWPMNDSAIGLAVRGLRDRWPGRFVIRFSDQEDPEGWTTEVIEDALDASPGSIICPAEQHKTACCATCGLCWATSRKIAFLRH